MYLLLNLNLLILYQIFIEMSKKKELHDVVLLNVKYLLVITWQRP